MAFIEALQVTTVCAENITLNRLRSTPFVEYRLFYDSFPMKMSAGSFSE
jgi:hypothetical protein